MSPIMANLIIKLSISRPKFIFGGDPRHQEEQRVRHELAERHGADCTALTISDGTISDGTITGMHSIVHI